MKRYLLVLCLLSVCFHCIGQSNDSILNSLKERVEQAVHNNDGIALLNIEPDFDAYYNKLSYPTADELIQYARFKIYVGRYYVTTKNLDMAEKNLLSAISLCEYLPKLKTYACGILSLCYSYMSMEKEAHDNYRDAIQYSLLTISYAAIAEDENRVVEQYIALGREYTYTNQYEKARASFNEAEKRLCNLSDSLLLRAELISGEADLEKKLENYIVAIKLLEQAHSIYLSSSISNKSEYLQPVCASLYNLYRFNLHNEEKAVYWEKQALLNKYSSNEDSISGKTDFLDLKSKFVSIVKLQTQGKYDEVISKYQQLIQSLSSSPSVDNQIMMASCYSHLGLCYLRLKQYQQAISEFNSAISIYELVSDKTEIIDCYTNSSYAYYYIDDIKGAIECAQKALSIALTIYADDSQHLADCYKNLANMHAFNSDTVLAKQYLIKSVEIKEKDIRQTFSLLTSQERRNYWKRKQQDIINMQPFLLRFNETQSQYSDALYDVQLLTKGLLLQSNIELQLIVSESTPLQPLLKEIIKIRKQLTRGNLELDTIAELKNKAEQIERELTIQSKETGDFLHFLDITHKDIRDHLSPNSMAIEFASFRYRKDSLMTVAYIIKNEWEHALIIPLYEERDILPLISVSDNDSSSINEMYNYHNKGAKLKSLVWENILKHTQPGDTIYFAPTDLLHYIAIENLPYDAKRTMSDVFNMVRLSSTREIVKEKHSVRPSYASLYGGIYYNATSEDLMVQHTTYESYDFDASDLLALRDINESGVQNLPETGVEIRQIQKVLTKKHISVHCDSAKSATEESFKAISGKGQNIIHIATHGFYWPDSIARKEKYLAQHTLSENDKSSTQTIDPLERCGLLFAGANIALSGHRELLRSGVQDGVLTANEIARMDLRGADIVVLSACETGLGDITGEGVFGLQRSFKMAGAQTILMALWKVHDEATRKLMTLFYRNWIIGRQTKHEAFRNAQQEMRQGKYASPYYWAGFIILD